MSRNRYTRLVHDRDEAQLNRQLRDTHRLVWALRRQPADVVEQPAIDEPKVRRRIRLEQKRCHKPTPVLISTNA